MKTLLTIALAGLLVAPACKQHENKAAGDQKTVDDGAGKTTPPPSGAVIRMDGSSTVLLISQAVAEDFQSAHGGKITVAEAGTGGGFKKFCRGEIDIADASRPIKKEEAESCKSAGIDFIELPVAYDGLAVVVNKDNSFVDKLTVSELKTLWAPEAQGKVKSWKDVRQTFPDQPIGLYGPGVDSGTYDYFTQAIVGKEHSSRGDYTSSEDDNVLVQGVAGDKGAMGFFGYAYYAANQDKLKLVPIDAEKGKGAVAPSSETVVSGAYQPLSRPLFIYVSSKVATRSDIAALVAFYLKEGRALVKEVGYVPLPDAAYELAQKRFDGKKTGSMFEGGSQVGVSIEQLLSKE